MNTTYTDFVSAKCSAAHTQVRYYMHLFVFARQHLLTCDAMSVFSQTLLLPIITASRKELTVQSRCPDTVGVRRFTGQKLLRSEQRYGTIHCSDDVYLLITRLQTIVCKSWKKEMGTSVTYYSSLRAVVHFCYAYPGPFCTASFRK